MTLFVVLVLLLATGLTLGKLAAAWPFTTDDAYITLRYSKHLAAGEGVVWNVGEPRVEGYSNFLFVLVGAAAIRLGLEPITVLKTLGAVALLVSAFVLFAWARRRVGSLLACLPFLILTSYLGSIWWSVSGLETAVYQLLVIVAAFLFVTGLGPAADQRNAAFDLSTWRLSAAGALAFLASLTRPEGPVVVIAMVAALIVYILTSRATAEPSEGATRTAASASAGLRACAILLLAFGIPYALYFLWRWSYFGRLLPNSVYCKGAWEGDSFTLLKSFWGDWKILILLSLAIPWSAVGVKRLFIWMLTVGYLVILIGVDPIIGYVNRHMLAVLPLLLLSATLSLHWILQAGLRQRWLRPASYAIVAATLLMLLVNQTDTIKRTQASAERYARRMITRDQLGHWINERLGPEQRYLIGDSGLVPYLTQAKVLDAFCLNNPAATTTLLGASPGRLAEALIGQRPDLVIVHSERPDRLEPKTYLDIYPAILDLPEFSADFAPTAVFTTPRGITHYFVFERREHAEDGAPPT